MTTIKHLNTVLIFLEIERAVLTFSNQIYVIVKELKLEVKLESSFTTSAMLAGLYEI